MVGEAVWDPCPAELGRNTGHCYPAAGKHTYLVGCSYESEDVHRRVGPHVITEQRVEMRDGRQGAVFVGHTV